MKAPVSWLAVTTALATVAAISSPVLSQTDVLTVAPQSQSMTVRGRSGGQTKSDCGFIPGAPSQHLRLTEALPYLRLSVQSPKGQPTLLVDGPSGRFCIMSDSYSNGNPEVSGFWPAGTYSIYVGDRAQGQHPYTLTISQKH